MCYRSHCSCCVGCPCLYNERRMRISMEAFIKTSVGQALRVFKDLVTYKNDKQALLSIREQVQNLKTEILGRDDLVSTINYYVKKIESRENKV